VSDDLFPETKPAPRPTAEKLSPDRARTQRAEQRIARGLHPFGMKLRAEPGETCGSCKHLRVKKYAGTYFKCALGTDSKGPASDARKWWPACERWEATP